MRYFSTKLKAAWAFVATFLFTAATSSPAFALTQPAAGDFAYTVYDIAINKIMGGPIGFVIGFGIIAFAIFLATKQQIIPAIVSLVAGAALIKADAIVASLGAVI